MARAPPVPVGLPGLALRLVDLVALVSTGLFEPAGQPALGAELADPYWVAEVVVARVSASILEKREQCP